jgi:hypothetical protein
MFPLAPVNNGGLGEPSGSTTHTTHQMTTKQTIKIGDRIRVTDHQSPLSKAVIYTVQGTRKGLPVVHDYWQAVTVRSFEKVP